MITKNLNGSERNSEKFKLSISDSVQLVNVAHWESVVADKNVYLGLPYLRALETTLSLKIDFRYILFYNHTLNPVGLAVVQLHRFSSGEIDFLPLSKLVGDEIPVKLLDKMEIRVMLCGNAFSTGENGFLFSDKVSEKVANVNLMNALHRIRKDEKKSNDKVSMVLLKDFWPESFDKIKVFGTDRFREISIDMNMVLLIRSNWTSWEGYLEDLTTKFRTKAKGIYNKSEQILSRRLSADEIGTNSNAIDELYLEVIDQKFRFGVLSAATFEAFKRNLDSNFTLMGYFLEGELVGFSTSFLAGRALEANFVGIRYDINVQYALYQRMICDYIKRAIELKCAELRLGRTAEEIKSSFGATPVNMKLLIKHRNAITNTLIKPLVNSIEPSPFELRKPFKAAVYQEN